MVTGQRPGHPPPRELLEKAGAVLERGLWPLRRGLRIRLERPEYWIDYLDRPARFESPE